jgi:hypothetical protein
MRTARPYGESRECGRKSRPRTEGQEDCAVSNMRYAGHGVEIEEDVVRLHRRKLEFESDTVRRPDPRPLRIFHPVGAVSSMIASRR